MSKGLKELKEIELKWQYGVFTFIPNFEIIEEELKERDELVQTLSIVTCENGELLKYKQALEIIKNNTNCYATLETFISLLEIGKITQEEFDLLKEVLL